MAPTNQQKLDAIYDALFNGGTSMPQGLPLKDLIDGIPKRVANYPVLRDGKTLSWVQDTANGTTAATGLPAAVLNQAFTLPDGTVTNLAGILAQINAKPAGSAAVAQVDVDALAEKLTAALPPAVVSALAVKLSQP